MFNKDKKLIRKIPLNLTVEPEDLEFWYRIQRVENFKHGKMRNSDIFKKLIEAYKELNPKILKFEEEEK
jgi:hypothetical protein